MSNYADRANDIVRAVHLLRQHGIAVGFPMQTADGEIIFPVDKNFTLTADQILELNATGLLDSRVPDLGPPHLLGFVQSPVG